MSKSNAKKVKKVIGDAATALQNFVDVVNEKMTADNIKKGIDSEGNAMQDFVDKCDKKINEHKEKYVKFPYPIGTKFMRKNGCSDLYQIKEYVVKAENEILVVMENCRDGMRGKRLTLKEFEERYALYTESTEEDDSFFESDDDEDE